MATQCPITTPHILQELQEAKDTEGKNIERTIAFFETGSLNEVYASNETLAAEELIANEDPSESETDDENEDNEKGEKAEKMEVQTSSPYEEISGTLEGMSVAFFAGYAAFKTVKQYRCDRCLDEMQKPPDAEKDVNESYIKFREYDTQKSWQLRLP